MVRHTDLEMTVTEEEVYIQSPGDRMAHTATWRRTRVSWEVERVGRCG